MDPLYLLAGLFAVGAAIQWAAVKLRVPALVLLLATGLAAGPLTGLVDPDRAFEELLEPFVALSVALVLFEGGITLRLAEVRKLGAPLLALVLGGLVLTFGTTTLAARWLAGLDWGTASVLGAILVVTGPTVVKPMLRQAKIARRPALLLKWESIVNDPLGALLAVVVLEVALLGPGELGSILLTIAVAGVVGLVAGMLLGRALLVGAIPEHLKTPCILGGALGVFAGADALFHEAGLLAVTVMGVVLANTRSASVEDVRRFKEEVATILVSVLFLVLSARLAPSEVMAAFRPGALAFVAAVLFVCRPVSALGSLALTKLPLGEKLFIGWIAPRGVVAAAMGAALAPRLEEAGFARASELVPLLFGVILATVVLHGGTVGPLARRLGLTGRSGGGLLIVGASNWAVDLARLLAQEGVDAVVVDSNFRNTAQARMRGVEAMHGDVLDEETLDELPLERIQWVLAGTGDDHYNALASMALVKTVGRENVLQLPPHDGAEEESHLAGRRTWGAEASFGRLTSRYWKGAHFRCTRLDEREYDWEEFRATNEGAVVLFELTPRGLEPLEEGETPEPGARIVYLPAA